MTDLRNLSADKLETLANKALDLAKSLRAKQPGYELALTYGVKDNSYNTVANGRISSFSGEAVITMDDGKKWRAVGHRPQGNAYAVSRQGYIEFTPLDD